MIDTVSYSAYMKVKYDGKKTCLWLENVING